MSDSKGSVPWVTDTPGIPVDTGKTLLLTSVGTTQEIETIGALLKAIGLMKWALAPTRRSPRSAWTAGTHNAELTRGLVATIRLTRMGERR